MLHEHGQPRAADVFPARNSLVFEELKSSESGPLDVIQRFIAACECSDRSGTW